MSQSVKISKYLGKDSEGNDEFVITVPPAKEWNGNPTEQTIKIAHDYIQIDGECSFQLESGVNKPASQDFGASNWLESRASIQIGIREVFSVILPFLNNHEYLQPKHFEDIIYHQDDPYWHKDKTLTGPRYKKGDKYPAYAHDGGIIHYVNEGRHMIAFRRSGSSHFEHVSNATFQLIKESLKLTYTNPKEFEL
jgi:hypothetical protein